MSDTVKKILIGIVSCLGLAIVVVFLCLKGVIPALYYTGIVICALTALCVLVFFCMKLADVIKKGEYSRTNAKYATAMEVMFWCGFWWTYAAKAIQDLALSFKNK